LSVEAVLAGTAPGEIYVDQIDNPRVGLAFTPEGEYLAGDAEVEAAYQGLKETISPRAYLIFHPERWETKLGQIWVNQAARRHPRQHLRFERMLIPNWRQLIPAGFQLVQVDRAFLERTDLKNHDTVVDRLGGWHSVDYFLQHGFGFCMIEGDTVASCCFADCVVGNQCEMGIATDMKYRRRGLATVVVAATVEYCLANGLTQIGWHCLQSNVGSRSVAEKVGFAVDQEYDAYSSVLPTENAADLTRDEYIEWARHYESFIAADYAYGYDAANAWALAGEPERALAHLQTLLDHGWQGKPEWLARNWPFASLHSMPEFEAMVARLRQQEQVT
jgi:RimJ/RimL family protein N-acetyltransferase